MPLSSRMRSFRRSEMVIEEEARRADQAFRIASSLSNQANWPNAKTIDHMHI